MNGKYKYSYYNSEVKRYGLIKKDIWVDIRMIKSTVMEFSNGVVVKFMKAVG